MNTPKNILKNKLLPKLLKLSSISVVANFLGFLIPIYIAYKYSISKQTDDFFLSYSIIMFVGTIFAGSVRTVIIPFLKERLYDKELFNRFISSVFFYATNILIVVCILLFVTTGAIYFFTHKQFYWYLFLSIPIVYLSVINSLFYGVLNSLDQFYIAELSPIPRALIIFLMIYLFGSTLGMSAVIIGYNLGELGKFIHLLYVIKVRNNIQISRKLNHPAEIKSFLKQGMYQIMSVTISASAPMVDRLVASFLTIGAVSMLDYGDKIFSVFSVLLGSFLTLLLSKWSADAVKGYFNISKLHKIMAVMLVTSGFAFVFILLFKIQIVGIIYPKINIADRELIAYLLLINMIGFVLNSLNQTVNSAIIVMKFTNIMITTSTIRVIANFVFDIIFAYFWGLKGIVYASVIMHATGLLANYYLFRKKQSLQTTIKPEAAFAN